MAQVDYPAILAEAWQQAIAPRDACAPTVISLFAGGGGSSLGYLMAGYKESLAVEWDDNAVATLRLNFPDLDIYHGDIAKLSVGEVSQRTGLALGELDVLDGSPPCQGFSMAGKRQLNDPRNQLFREYIRLLRGLQPKVFVIENVSGLVKGKMKLVFVEMLQELKASGYQVSARLLNAMYFRVPQNRERLIFVGVRQDLELEPSHPQAHSRPIVLREALVNVQFTEEQLRVAYYKPESKSAMLLANLKQWEQGAKLTGSSYFGLKRLAWSRPSATVLKQDATVGLACSCCHPIENRRLTIPELKRVGSFPDEYQLTGGYALEWERVGNSVPPLMMRAIAAHIQGNILGRLEQTERYQNA